MATIKIEFDTKTKAMTAKMDGKELANVESIGFYKKPDYADEELPEGYFFDMCMREPNEEEDYRHITHISAAAAKNETAVEIEELPDYVTYKSKSTQDKTRTLISKYLESVRS